MRTSTWGLSCRLHSKRYHRQQAFQHSGSQLQPTRQRWRRGVRCLAEEESSKAEQTSSRKEGSANTIASLNALLGVDEEEEKRKEKEEEERRQRGREQREDNGQDVRLSASHGIPAP